MAPVDLFLLLSNFGLGLRHGVDWDHLSAIADITGAEYERRRAAVLAVLYAVGHGISVMALGAVAIVLGDTLPTWIDPFMDRLVGVTLLVLAFMLVRSLRRGDGRPVSRGMLLFRALGDLRRRLRRTERVEIEHAHPDAHHGHAVATTHVHKVDVTRYTVGGAIAVGLLHGVGAETGTQAVVLVSATHVTSTLGGVAILAAFVLGIIATTALLAVGAAFGWTAVSRSNRVFRYATVATAALSTVIGLMFVTGASDRLPAILA